MSSHSTTTKQTDFLSSEVIAAGAVLLLAIGYLLVGYLTLSPGIDWGDDWAQYVSHARNLVTGRAYADTGYIFNPQAPHIGPPSYPPGFPLLLAPIVKVFGLDIIALKSVSLVCMTAAILFTFLLFRDALGAGVAAGTAFLFGLHWFSWSIRNYIVSEPPYILWTLLSLYVASRHVHGRGIVTGALCGLFAYAAFATRPIGIVLIFAVLAYEIAQRRLFSWRFLCIAGIPAVGIELQRHLLTVGDYSAELHFPVMTELAGNVLYYGSTAAFFFPLGRKLFLLSDFVLAALVLLGIRYRLRSADERVRSAASPSGLPPWALLQRIPVDVWYLGLYLGALVVLPIYQLRYFFPILPILCAYIVYAISRGLERTRYGRAAILALCAVGMCYYAAVWVHHGTPGDDDALCDDCRAMYTYIRNDTAPGSRVAFAKPRVMALLTNRPAWWANSEGRRFDWDALQRTHINYIVLVPPTHPLASRYPAELGWDAWRSSPKLHLMFENVSFRVLRLNSTEDQ